MNESDNPRVDPEAHSPGQTVVNAVRGLLHEGINRRVVVRDSQGGVVMDAPLAVGVVAALAAPVATAIGTGVALVGKCGISLENRAAPATAPAPVVDPDAAV